MHVIELIHEIRATSKRTEKLALLKKADSPEIRKAFLWAYDPFKNYFVTSPAKIVSKPVWRKKDSDGPSSDFLQDFQTSNPEATYKCLNSLATRAVTGHAAKELIFCTYHSLVPDLAELFLLILDKDFKIGCDVKTINAAYSDLIPTFDIMLASTGEPTEFPGVADLKYDGVRCLAFVYKNGVQFFGRGGIQAILPRLEQDLLKLNFPEPVVLDGELISWPENGVLETRKEVSGRFNKILKNPDNARELERFAYVIFDYLSLDEWKAQECAMGFESRRSWLKEDTNLSVLIAGMHCTIDYDDSSRLRIANSVVIDSAEEAESYFNNVRTHGEEGVVFKPPNSKYEWKRSKNWIRKKAKETIDLRVIGYTIGEKGPRLGKINSLECSTECGRIKTFVGSGFTEADIDSLDESVVGKIVEVEYNEVISKAGETVKSLFLPIFKGFRPDKTEADSYDG